MAKGGLLAVTWVAMFCRAFTVVRTLRTSPLQRLRGGASLAGQQQRALSAAASAPASATLQSLREEMRQSGLDALLVPTDDPHVSEYVPAHFARREFVSGFTGSAGTALITLSAALLFTDGRYFQQAERELSAEWTLMRAGTEGVPSLSQYLQQTLSAFSAVGIDPWVHSVQDAQRLRNDLRDKAITLKLTRSNLVDKVWSDAHTHAQRPALPAHPLRLHPLQLAGQSTLSKLEKIRERMRNESAEALVIGALDEIMWLLNVRGRDIPCNPVAFCYAVVQNDSVSLFIDQSKITDEVRVYLEENNVIVRPYEAILPFVKALNKHKVKTWIDPKTVNVAIGQCLSKANAIEKASPLVLMKATKNLAEIAGMRKCHERDAVAFVEFIAWLEEELRQGKTISEFDIDVELTRSRAQCDEFLEPSFDTIAGVNENGAIVHYRAPKENCKTLTKEDMLLLDSGGQYLDGTTDVTRTFHFGTPTAQQREMYTRVLKGHISIDRSVFPVGTQGCLIDSFARQHLWKVGKNYNHGTGHGVGAALNVHEGPQRISPLLHDQGLQAGMIVSNEPGYYAANEFGIRIENLLVVVEKSELGTFSGKGFLGFERLTLIPIQKELIEVALLDAAEREWIDQYHSEINEKIRPLLRTERARTWLDEATKKINV